MSGQNDPVISAMTEKLTAMAAAMQEMAKEQSHTSRTLIRMEERQKTVDERGCVTGVRMTAEIENTLHKRIDGVDTRIDRQRNYAAAGGISGGFLIVFLQWLGLSK